MECRSPHLESVASASRALPALGLDAGERRHTNDQPAADWCSSFRLFGRRKAALPELEGFLTPSLLSRYLHIQVVYVPPRKLTDAFPGVREPWLHLLPLDPVGFYKAEFSSQRFR